MSKRIALRPAREAFERALANHEQVFEHFFLAQLLDMKFEYPEGRCVIRMTPGEFLFNPQGSLHGGILTTAMDISMGHLIRHLHRPASTLSINVQFLEPVFLGPITVTGTIAKGGKSLFFTESEVRREDGVVAATATAVWKLRRLDAKTG